jgi:hypothetical protein
MDYPTCLALKGWKTRIEGRDFVTKPWGIKQELTELRDEGGKDGKWGIQCRRILHFPRDGDGLSLAQTSLADWYELPTFCGWMMSEFTIRIHPV